MCSLNNSFAQDSFSGLPKVELHLHLDCSLSYECVKQLKPSVSLEEYNNSFIAPPKCTDLADYITRAIKGFELMQTKEQLRLVTLDLFKQLKKFLKHHPEIDIDTHYVFFKNNCPLVGSTYDDFRICNIEEGNVQYTVTPNRVTKQRHKETIRISEVWGRANEFKQPIKQATTFTQLLKD